MCGIDIKHKNIVKDNVKVILSTLTYPRSIYDEQNVG